MKDFFDNSPTAYHAVYELTKRFAQSGFEELKEEEIWSLEAGKSYYLVKEGALAAFSLPEKLPKLARILATHTDSPGLKLKPKPEQHQKNMTLFAVEPYGAPLLSSWLNRDLAIAGKITRKDQSSELVFLEEMPCIIPQLAIHLDRKVNEEGLILNKQEHLLPIMGLDPAFSLEDFLEKEILSHDLFLVPLEKSRFLGRCNEWIASYRIDNLAGVHAAMSAMVQSRTSEETLQVALFLDHEEIGSRSPTGAASVFTTDLLKRIAMILEIKGQELYAFKSRSFLISVDMAHAFHPSYANRYDMSAPPLLGEGVVVKYNADLKYATTAKTAASIIAACLSLGLPHQSFISRSDVGCGSTIGPILSAALGIEAVDIGIPQLSMHSIREIMAGQDHLDLCSLLTHLIEG